MKKIVSILITVILTLNMTITAMASVTTDSPNHWASAQITTWSDYGIINGYPDGTFKPNSNVTRAEFVAIVDNLFAFDIVGEELTLSDVTPDKWYAGVVSRATALKLISGYPDGSFRPNEAITREDAVSVLYKAFQFEGEKEGSPEATQFTDAGNISDYAVSSVSYFSKMGYINGYADGSLRPQSRITRAEAISIIDNIVDLYCNKDNQIVEDMVVNNALIIAENVTLKNVEVNHSLTVARSMGDGDFTLDSATINGVTHINGGGSKSINVINSKIGRMIVAKDIGESVRVLLTGNSIIASLIANSKIIVEDKTVGEGYGVLKLTLSSKIPAKAAIELIGDFIEVNSEAGSIDIVLVGKIRKLHNSGLDLKINGSSIKKGSTDNYNTTTTNNSGGSHSDGSGDDSSEDPKKDPEEDPKEDPKSEWTLVWGDEFDGNSIDMTKWKYDIGNHLRDGEGNVIPENPGWGNDEKQYYTDSSKNSFVEDGKLVIKALKESTTDAYGSYDYTSALLSTHGLFSQTYGRYEISAKLPTGKGMWPAIWMMPANDEYGDWAASGELDIMEGWGSRPDTVAGTLHYGGQWPKNKYSGDDYVFESDTSVAEFHEYAIEWEPGVIRWYVDGDLYQTQDSWNTENSNGEKFSFPAPFDQDFYLMLNLAVGGHFDGDPTEDTEFPAEMEVEYVRVYELTGRDYNTPIEPNVEREALPEGAKSPDGEGNYLSNGNFQQAIQDNAEAQLDFADKWNFLYMDQFAGKGTQSIDTIDGTNFAKIDITEGGSQPHSIQLIQLMTLGKGRYYKVSFDAKAGSDRTMNMKLGGGAEAGWQVYSDNYTINLKDQIQHFERTFQMTGESDIAARLEFNLGTSTSPVWIGNVKLEEVDAPEINYLAPHKALDDGNTIYNGAFDKYTIDRLGYWNFNVDSSSAIASVDASSRQLALTITSGGDKASSIQLNQQGLQLDGLGEYELQFDAGADLVRDISVEVVSADGTTKYLPEETIRLEPSVTTHKMSFTMPEEKDYAGRINFNFGGSSHDLILDNVSLIKVGDDPVDEEEIDTGFERETFDSDDHGWTAWFEEGGQGTITTTDGALKVDITSVGEQSYQPQVLYEGFALKKGETYTVNFDVYADDARTMNVNIGKGLDSDPWFIPYAETQLVEITTEKQNISYEFTVDKETDENLKMVFELGKMGEEGILTTVYFDNIAITKNLSTPLETITFDSEEDALEVWWGDEWVGFGDGTVKVTDSALQVDITAVGSASYSPQMFYEGIKLEKGRTYTVEFDVYADEPKGINVNIGKALDTDPWFIAYAETEVITVTTSKQRVSYEFTVSETTDENLKMVFELGTVNGLGVTTTMYFDNISIKEKK